MLREQKVNEEEKSFSKKLFTGKSLLPDYKAHAFASVKSDLKKQRHFLRILEINIMIQKKSLLSYFDNSF